MEERKVSTLSALSILTLALVSMGITVVTPAIAVLIGHFAPEGSGVSPSTVTLISTLPTLTTVAGTFVAGSIMGKMMKYRTLAILGSILYLVGGCGPALFDDLTLTLVCRGILGFGLGLIAPLGNALIIGLYDGEKQAKMLGYGTMCMNAGGIILQMLGGALAGMNDGWKMVWWGHAFCILGLIMALFLPEPPAAAAPADSAAAPKEAMNPIIWVPSILFLIFNVVNFPVMMNVSVLFEVRQAGGAAAAATALSLYTVAGVVAGLIFGYIFKPLQKWCIVIGYTLCGLGALCVWQGMTNIVMTLGLIIIGFGFSFVMPSFMIWIGMATPPSTVAAATSILLALMNLGGFLSSFWLQLLTSVAGESLYSAIIVSMIVQFATAALFLFINPFKPKN